MASNMLSKLYAVTIKPEDIGAPNVNLDTSTMGTVMNTVYLWAGIVAVLVLIIAGFIFITSNGDSSKIVRAKNTVLGAVIGLVIILFAFVITQFVIRGVNQGA